MVFLSHASVKRSIISTKITIDVKFRSFLLWRSRFRFWFLLLGFFMLLFLVLMVIFLFLIMLIVFFVLVFLFLLALILFAYSQLFLNLLNQSRNLFHRNLVLFQNMRMLKIQLLSDFHGVRIQNKSLQQNRIHFLFLICLLVLVMNADDWWLVTNTQSYSII